MRSGCGEWAHAVDKTMHIENHAVLRVRTHRPPRPRRTTKGCRCKPIVGRAGRARAGSKTRAASGWPKGVARPAGAPLEPPTKPDELRRTQRAGIGGPEILAARSASRPSLSRGSSRAGNHMHAPASRARSARTRAAEGSRVLPRHSLEETTPAAYPLRRNSGAARILLNPAACLNRRDTRRPPCDIPDRRAALLRWDSVFTPARCRRTSLGRTLGRACV